MVALRAMLRETPETGHRRPKLDRIPLANRGTQNFTLFTGTQNTAAGFGEAAGAVVGEG